MRIESPGVTDHALLANVLPDQHHPQIHEAEHLTTGGDRIDAIARGIYGNGSDGNAIIAVDTHLTRDMYYWQLNILPGVTLYPDGFRIFVEDVFINEGTIANDGNPGADAVGVDHGVGGGVTPAGSIGYGQPGGDGADGEFGEGSPGNSGFNAEPSDQYGWAGAGGKGGDGFNGVGADGGIGGFCNLPAVYGGYRDLVSAIRGLGIGVGPLLDYLYGGAGGGGGGSGGGGDGYPDSGGGGGGGGGGGVIIIAARIAFTVGAISVKGGDGGRGGDASGPNAGGGGGGGGGIGGHIVLICDRHDFPFFHTDGGNGGSGGNGIGTGTNGANGVQGVDGLWVIILNN